MTTHGFQVALSRRKSSKPTLVAYYNNKGFFMFLNRCIQGKLETASRDVQGCQMCHKTIQSGRFLLNLCQKATVNTVWIDSLCDCFTGKRNIFTLFFFWWIHFSTTSLIITIIISFSEESVQSLIFVAHENLGSS